MPDRTRTPPGSCAHSSGRSASAGAYDHRPPSATAPPVPARASPKPRRPHRVPRPWRDRREPNPVAVLRDGRRRRAASVRHSDRSNPPICGVITAASGSSAAIHSYCRHPRARPRGGSRRSGAHRRRDPAPRAHPRSEPGLPATGEPVNVARCPETRVNDVPRHHTSAPGRNRTCDTRFRKPLLYPLSYEGGGLQETRQETPVRAASSLPRHLRSCERAVERGSGRLQSGGSGSSACERRG